MTIMLRITMFKTNSSMSDNSLPFENFRILWKPMKFQAIINEMAKLLAVMA